MNKSVVFFLHLVYWLLYLLLLALVILFVIHAKTPLSFNAFIRTLFLSPFGVTCIPSALGFYSFYTFMFTYFLSRKKISLLFLFGIAVALLCGWAGSMLYRYFAPETVFENGYDPMLSIMLSMSLLALVHGVIGLVMKGFITWYNDIRLKENLYKKNLETELALIKSQLDPHFLFNTINNIDVLITKDATAASDYLNKLSDMMRFMLYETKPGKILLSKELTYIEKYIDLQKIRTANSDYVNYSVAGNVTKVMIAPMLFIPFIENAFKHAGNKKTGNAILIKITIETGKIMFECENSFLLHAHVKPNSGGLGNELIKKRLMLLYPDSHILTLSAENEIYSVKLTLYTNAN